MATESRYNGALIRVENWSKYNPRPDVYKPSWFRLDKDLALGSKLFGLNCEMKWLWICILSLACQSNGESFVWNADFIQAITGLCKKSQDQALDIFIEKFELHVDVTSAPVDVTSAPAINERTRRTNEQNKTNPQIAELLETLYQKYPRKMGKQEGLKKAAREIRSLEDAKRLEIAVERFNEFHRDKGTEEKFVPYFSSFMTFWKDWLDPETGSSSIGESAAVDIEAILAKREGQPA